MKKVLFSACMIALTFGAAMAQTKPAGETKPTTAPATTPAPNPNAPKIKFAVESHDFGTVVEGPQVTYDFKFKNEGKEPLVLNNVRASCGCTVPTWPKEPILPGKESVISATFNTQGRPGSFSKTITVESNASEPSKVVTIRGEVIKPEEDKSIPLAKPSMIRAKD